MSIRTTDYNESDFSAGKGWLSMSHRSDDYATGTFYHPLGIVDVSRGRDYTHLTYCHDGRVYWRLWDASWGDRTIPRLARQFVNDARES